MLTTLRTKLESLGAFNDEVPDIIKYIADAIPFANVPLRMKYTIAVSELILYASQFRRNINHWNGSSVPINGISFVLTASGQNKDSSLSATRSCFKAGYDIIEAERKKLAKDNAIKRATEAGVDEPHRWENYKDFYRNPNPLFAAPSTNEGMVQHINDLESDGIGAAYMYSGEFGAELAMSPIFTENLQLIAELYDLGNKDVKLLKGRENQSSTIKSFPVSALFQGSPGNILYDEQVKKKFRTEFTTKFARRSFFCFIPELTKLEDFDNDIEKLINSKRSGNNKSIMTRSQVSDGIVEITKDQLKLAGTPLDVDAGVFELFVIYERYNQELADTMSKLHTISQLARKHMQWKALKLAGAIAIIYQHDSITQNDYLEAIRFTEMLDKDLSLFENELTKEPYELFSDYMKSIIDNGKSFCTIHVLRKLGYLPTAGNPLQKLKELSYLAASYDPNGIYTFSDKGAHYEQLVPTEELVFSYKEIDVSNILSAIASGDSAAVKKAKGIVAAQACNGLLTGKATFADLANILTGTYAYAPFEFVNGKHHGDNLLPTTKWLVYDIDKSMITMQEAHFLLSDINHHIAPTSDVTNQFKFRVFIELDSPVDLSPTIWKLFYESIARELGLTVDTLPQSQLFYSYGSDTILSTTDALPVQVRDHIMYANDKAAIHEPTKPATKSQIEAMINDPYTTFNYAYECRNNGAGSRTMIRAAKHAKDLGMTKDAILDLIKDINDYWVLPMDDDRLENTIIAQINRWVF